MEVNFWHLVMVAPPANDCPGGKSTERLPSRWRALRVALASLAREVIVDRYGLTYDYLGETWQESRTAAWDRLHGRRPLCPEHIHSLDVNVANDVYEALARGKRAA